MVPLVRIGLTTSSLPRKCSTTEPQRLYVECTLAYNEINEKKISAIRLNNRNV